MSRLARLLLAPVRWLADAPPPWEQPVHAPAGEDEQYIIGWYQAQRHTSGGRLPQWPDLQEWQREQWRMEYRDTYSTHA